MNLPNRGQIPNLPLGVVVETLGAVDVTGVQPFSAGPLPPGVASVVQTHVDNQEMIVAAALDESRSLALRALANDPMVRDLAGAEAMLDELLDANRQYAPLASERIC